MVSFSGVTKTYTVRGTVRLRERKTVRTVVDNFSLSVDVPIFGFLGQNGAGKTTIMKMVMGLLAPTSGSILIDGMPSASAAAKGKIGFMPETPYFYERMTGMEFLKFCNELYGDGGTKGGTPSGGQKKERSATVSGIGRGSHNIAHYESILRKVGIFDARDAEIKTYSKGMRQRLGFAQALVNDPEYLFLDEPLDGLDPLGRREMKEVMLALKAEGRRIFLNTHILYDVEEICDEVGIIDKGKLLYAGGVKAFCAGKPLEERFVETVAGVAHAH